MARCHFERMREILKRPDFSPRVEMTLKRPDFSPRVEMTNYRFFGNAPVVLRIINLKSLIRLFRVSIVSFFRKINFTVLDR